jgi:hypothetical protein
VEYKVKTIIENSKIVKAIYNEKYLTIVFAVLFVLSLLPLFVIAFYNYPGGDDFYHGADTREAFMETRNIAAVLAASFNYIGWAYNHRQGRFFDTFLCTLNPAVFSESLYPITTFIMLFMLICSTLFFLQTIFVRVLGLDWKYVVLFGMPVLFFSIQSPPSPLQGFFWFSGALAYTFFYSLMLFLLGTCIRLWRAGPSKAAPYWQNAILTMLLCFMISGGNYITALSTALLLLAFVVSCFIFKRARSVKIAFVVSLVLFFVGLAVNVSSPGTDIRLAGSNQNTALAAIVKSFSYAGAHFIGWFDLRIVSALLFLSPIFYKMAKKTNYSFKYPLLTALASYCFYAAGFAPTAYAQNWSGDARVKNIIYYTLILLVFLNYFNLVGYIAHAAKGQQTALDRGFLVRCAYAASLFALVFLLFSAFYRGEHSSYIAIRDLYNGTVKQYSLEMEERYRIYHDDSIKQVELAPLSVKPELLFWTDLKTEDNRDHWLNRDVARFYKKEYVFVKETNP